MCEGTSDLRSFAFKLRKSLINCISFLNWVSVRPCTSSLFYFNRVTCFVEQYCLFIYFIILSTVLVSYFINVRVLLLTTKVLIIQSYYSKVQWVTLLSFLFNPKFSPASFQQEKRKMLGKICFFFNYFHYMSSIYLFSHRIKSTFIVLLFRIMPKHL